VSTLTTTPDHARSQGAPEKGSAPHLPDLPYAGREAEHRLIDRLVADAWSGRGALVLLEGEPGAGRARLLNEVERRLSDTVHCIRVASGEIGSSGSPAWQQVMDRLTASDDPQRQDPDCGVPGSLADSSAVDCRPLVVLADEVTREAAAGEGMQRLLDGLDASPVLFLAVISRDDDSPIGSGLFGRWLAHPCVVSLRLGPLPKETMARLVRAELPYASAEQVTAIVNVAAGNPGVARELSRLHARGDAAAPKGPEAIAAMPLLARLIGRSPHLPALEVVAASYGSISAESLAAVLGQEVGAMKRTLDEAAARGLLSPSGLIPVAYSVSHELVGAVARAMTPPWRRTEIHRHLSVLAVERSERYGIGEREAMIIAGHLAGAGMRDRAAAAAFRRAAQFAEAKGELGRARKWVGLGLAADAAPADQCRLLMMIGSIDERSGVVAQGISTLTRAFALAEDLGDQELMGEATVRLLDATHAGSPIDVDAVALATKALATAGESPTALRARLHAHLAYLSIGTDPAAYRRHRSTAAALADSVTEIRAKTAAIYASTASPRPHDLERCLRLADKGLGLPAGAALCALPALSFANLAIGRRAVVDTALEELSTLEGTCRQRRARVDLALVSLGLALLELDPGRFATAARELSAEASTWGASYARTAAQLWQGCTGAPVAGVPRAALAVASDWPTLTVPAAVRRLLAPKPLADPDVRDAARELLELVDGPAAVPADGTWSAWMIALGRAAAASGRWDLWTRVAEELEPFADQFALLGFALPVGPFGWYLASALQELGLSEQALAANARAMAVSRRLGGRGWISHCEAQRAELLAVATARVPEGSQAVRVHAPAATTAGHRARPQRPAVRPPKPPAVDRKTVRDTIETLSDTDLTILLLMTDGASNDRIAQATHLSVPTIERRLSRIYRLLGASNRAQTVAVVTHPGVNVKQLLRQRNGRDPGVRSTQAVLPARVRDDA
jgi:DNA-binding CsgD family transcriptional regulator